MEINLSVYPCQKRRRKKSLKSEVIVLRAEMAQLQHRHNNLLKAILVLAEGREVSSEIIRSRMAVTSQEEVDFISRSFGVDPEDDLLTTEEEILNLLEG